MGKCSKFAPLAFPLGLFPDTQYDEVIVDLRPGDIVLFASDGILETENTEQEEFGLKRLTAVLKTVSPQHSAKEIFDKILDATDEYGGGGFFQAMTAPCWCCA